MIPHVVSATSLTFFAGGMPFVIAYDHPNFTSVRDLLASGSDDERLAIRLADITIAVQEATGHRGELTEDGLLIDGQKMPDIWSRAAVERPETTRVLVIKVGDRVRIDGDEDAPDGVYTVGDTDINDIDKTIMIESDDGFFGFVGNASVVEVLVPDGTIAQSD